MQLPLTEAAGLLELGILGVFVGALVYMMRAQSAAQKELAAILRPDRIEVEIDAEQEKRITAALVAVVDVKKEIAQMSERIVSVQQDTAEIRGRLSANERPPSDRNSIPGEAA